MKLACVLVRWTTFLSLFFGSIGLVPEALSEAVRVEGESPSHLRAGSIYRRFYRKLRVGAIDPLDPSEFGSTRAQLQNMHFILVGGFGGEFLEGAYLRPLASQLVLLGAGSSEIIQPSSRSDIESNSAWLSDQIESRITSLRESNPKAKVILIGHSKGGAEVQDLILSRPDLLVQSVRKRPAVHLVMTLQAPLCDCDLANVLSPHISRIRQAPVGLGRIANRLGSGVESLSLSKLYDLRQQRLNALSFHPKGAWVMEQLRRRTLHIATEAPTDRLPSSVALFERLRQATSSNEESSDGIIATRHMQQPEIGFPVEVIQGVDHLSPVVDANSLFSRLLVLKAHRFDLAEWTQAVLALHSWAVPRFLNDRNQLLIELSRVQSAMAMTLAQLAVNHLSWLDSTNKKSVDQRRFDRALSNRGPKRPCQSVFQ